MSLLALVALALALGGACTGASRNVTPDDPVMVQRMQRHGVTVVASAPSPAVRHE